MPFYFCFVNNTESKLSRSSRIGVQDGDIAASRDLPLPVTGTFAGCQLRKGKKRKEKKKTRECGAHLSSVSGDFHNRSLIPRCHT